MVDMELVFAFEAAIGHVTRWDPLNLSINKIFNSLKLLKFKLRDFLYCESFHYLLSVIRALNNKFFFSLHATISGIIIELY